MARQYLVAGNWKLNGSIAMADELSAAIARKCDQQAQTQVVICPPLTLLATVAANITATPIGLGAQNVSQYESGAYTGETSVSMLAEMGCRYVIVGHSERREYFGETPQVVAEKGWAAVAAGLIPIFCIGETLTERQQNKTERVLAEQLAPLKTRDLADINGLIIAYEPVWAIGTGETATPDQAQQTHEFIRSWLSEWDAELGQGTQILYGGSVKPDNAKELFSMPDVDGGLIGGASLTADSFVSICRAADSV